MWTCLELKQTKIVSMSSHEASKDEVDLAIIAKSQNIVWLNVHKQIYARPKMLEGIVQSPTASLALMEDDFNALLTQDHLNYDVVARGFHQCGITQMDTCIQRPIITTFSRDDCTIRFLNYVNGACVLSKRYQLVAAST